MVEKKKCLAMIVEGEMIMSSKPLQCNVVVKVTKTNSEQ